MKKAFLLLVVLAIVAAAGVAGMIYKRVNEPFKGYSGTEQFVTIEQGSSSRTIAQAALMTFSATLRCGRSCSAS